MQSITVMEYCLPIPFLLLVFSPVVSTINLIAQPLGFKSLSKYTQDCSRHAFKIVHVPRFSTTLTKVRHSMDCILVLRHCTRDSCLRTSLRSRMSTRGAMESHVLPESDSN